MILKNETPHTIRTHCIAVFRELSSWCVETVFRSQKHRESFCVLWHVMLNQ